jgi:hypothetical protein
MFKAVFTVRGMPLGVRVADFREVTAEYLASLPQHGEVILAVLFQHLLVIEHPSFPLFVPRRESLALGTTHVVITIFTFIGHQTHIAKIRLRVKVMRVPGLF